MGAEPLWCTLALSLPVADCDWLDAFARGFFALAQSFEVALIGGDPVHGPLATTVTVHGRVRRGEYLRRSGARPGDSIYVTGRPGDAVAGRHLLDPARSRHSVAVDDLIQAFLYPKPRIHEGRALLGYASAVIDISDGLDDDLGKLLRASHSGAELNAGALPVSHALQEYAGLAEARKLALTGGDDYELCFTVPPAGQAAFLELSNRWECAVTRIGSVTAGPQVRWVLDGEQFSVPATSYRHF
jgi:thiamine-monophosphate kinase